MKKGPIFSVLFFADEINRTRIRNSAPPIVVVSKNGSVERSVPNGMYEKNSATRSTPSPSTFGRLYDRSGIWAL